MDLDQPRILEKAGLKVGGALEVAPSQGVLTRAFEEAFDRGSNYLLLGILIVIFFHYP
ncbi:MAG: hypothetical protein SV375_06405 [Thermodesulfobacteriota bacterium]|nr:hypothetical protein [Thermodesulfobacteriota bacterium]